MSKAGANSTQQRGRFASLWIALAIAAVGLLTHPEPKIDSTAPSYGARTEQASNSQFRVEFKTKEQKQAHASGGSHGIFVPASFEIHFERSDPFVVPIRDAVTIASHRFSFAQPRAPPLT